MSASEPTKLQSSYDLPRPGKSGGAELIPAEPQGSVDSQLNSPSDRPGRPVCLVMPAEASRGLPPELATNLKASLPEVHAVTEGDFEFGSEVHPDAVWIMGCPASDFSSVASVRLRFPEAFVLVTCRNLSAAQAMEFEEAGADRALTWAGTIAGVRRELSGALV